MQYTAISETGSDLFLVDNGTLNKTNFFKKNVPLNLKEYILNVRTVLLVTKNYNKLLKKYDK